jgi:hypothetical protein
MSSRAVSPGDWDSTMSAVRVDVLGSSNHDNIKPIASRGRTSN